MYPLTDTSNQDEGKTYSEMAKMRSYWRYLKQPSAGVWKIKTKLSVRQKRNILQPTKRFQDEIENFFCKKGGGKSRLYTIH